MTLKEIAELSNTHEKTVLRWAQKLGAICTDLSAKCTENERAVFTNISLKLTEAQKTKKPADFILEETLAIIEKGGKNKTLAALLAENVANKERLTAINNRDIDLDRLIDGKIQLAMDKLEEKLTMLAIQNEQKRLPPPPELPDGDKIRAFVGQYLEITGKGAHFITLDDVFMLYQRETGDGIPRNILSYQLLRAYPVLSEKMRKVEYRMEKVITGCRPQEGLLMNGKLFSMDAHYKAMFDD
jgi:hypothetical protein